MHLKKVACCELLTFYSLKVLYQLKLIKQLYILNVLDAYESYNKHKTTVNSALPSLTTQESKGIKLCIVYCFLFQDGHTHNKK